MCTTHRTETFRSWLQETLDAEQIEDLAEYGADAGWPGLTYYSETGALYEAREPEIWDALSEDAADFGHASPLELVATFNGAKAVETDSQFRNLLVWYMAERTAREIADAGQKAER